MPMDSSALSPQMMKDLSIELGCDSYTEIDEEGERLWETLNDLSLNPAAYQEFILRQNKRQQSSSLAMPPFVPYSGFAVRSFVSNEKLWVNICQHDSVSKPYHGNGIPVLDLCQSTDGLQVPLLVSPMRKLCDGGNADALVVDVVVHSWCIEACRNPSFQVQLIDLVLQSIENDHTVKFLKDSAKRNIAYTISKKTKYKGGLGPDCSKPLPFEPHQKSLNETKLDSPEELLKCREKQESTSKTKELSLKMPGTGQSKVGARLVQPINEKIVLKRSGFQPGFLTASLNSHYLKDKCIANKSSGAGGSDGESKRSHDKAVGVACDDNSDSRPKPFSEYSPSFDAYPRKSEGERISVDTDVSLFNTDNELTVQIMLSCCQPPIQNMDELKLFISSNSLVLEAARCQKQWKLEFPSSVDDSSVSAKLRTKSQILVVRCLKTDKVLAE